MPSNLPEADRRTVLGLGAAGAAAASLLPLAGAAAAAAPATGVAKTSLTPSQALGRLF